MSASNSPRRWDGGEATQSVGEGSFARIDGTSRSFYIVSLALAVLVAAGVGATLLMNEQGLHLSGMTNRIPWGLQILLAILYVGLSVGSLVIASLHGVFGRAEYKPFARLAVFLAMLLLVGALLSIVTDQGRIDRVFTEPFAHGNPLSMLSINPFLYFTYLVLCTIYLVAMMIENERWTRILALVAVLWAILVRSGSGAIFGFVPRELYRSPLSPPSAVAAALSSGTALMILVVLVLFRLTRRPLDEKRVLGLGRLLAVFVVAAGYFVFVENAYRAYLNESRAAERFFLFGGGHSLLFWLGLVLLGTVVPLVLLLGRKRSLSVRRVAVAAALVVVGVFCERYLTVIPGLSHPPDLVPGWRITQSLAEEGVVTYAVSRYELFQALGVAALICLLFLWGLKLLKLLPTEARR
jgi:molybdopterin-containing oxidoreductase family membrane subunit